MKNREGQAPGREVYGHMEWLRREETPRSPSADNGAWFALKEEEGESQQTVEKQLLLISNQ